jgi:hypothetical protein
MAMVASKPAAQDEQNEDGSSESETSSNSSYASSSDGGSSKAPRPDSPISRRSREITCGTRLVSALPR